MPVGSSSDWIRWLKSSDPKLIDKAKICLGEITESDNVDVGPLVEALSSSDADVVFWVLVGLTGLGSRSESAIPRICSLGLEGTTPAIRQVAAMALVAIAPSHKSTSETLLLLFKDASPFVRREALQAMIRISDISAEDLSAISAMANDPDPTVASWSEVALRNIAARARQSN